MIHVGTLVHRRFTGDDVELLTARRRPGRACDRACAAPRADGAARRVEGELRRDRVARAAHAGHVRVRRPDDLAGARRDSWTQELRRELLRVGVEQGERLRRLLEELLDLSRLDCTWRQCQAEAARRWRASSARSSPDALPAGATVEFDVPDDLAVVADRLVLDRVVSNLLINAARYGRADHPLR